MKLSAIFIEIEQVAESFKDLLPTLEEFTQRALPILMKFTQGHLGPNKAKEFIESVYWNRMPIPDFRGFENILPKC